MIEYGTTFPDLTPQQLGEVTDLVPLVELDYGVEIIQQGEEDRTTLILLEGEVSLRRGDVEIAIAHKGELLGEMEFFGLPDRLTRAKVVAPGHALVVEPESYEALRRGGNPAAAQLERMVLAQCVSRLRAYHVRIAELSRGTEAEKPVPKPGFVERVATSLGMYGSKPAKDLDKVAALAEFRAFRDADPAALMELDAVFGARIYKEGKVICRMGEPADKMYMLAAGAVEVLLSTGEQRGSSLAILEPGDLFGFTSMVADRPRMAACIAKTQAVVLTLEKATWQQLHGSPERSASLLRRGICADLGLQAREAVQQLVKLELSARQDLAEHFAELEGEEGEDQDVPIQDLYFKD